MTESNADLAALIGSRICHDLISPIGAINNGLELLDLAGAMQGPELELISDSARNAGARVRFFRIAYGAAGDQMLGRAEIVSLLADMASGSRFTVHWKPCDPTPRAQVRLAFLAVQCCESAMPLGGDIRVSKDESTWTVAATAQKLSIDAGLWDRLTRPGLVAGLTPAQVQFALLPAAAAEQGRRVMTCHEASGVTVRF